ncbi:30S ribosomal protein S6 [Terrarubrum flagellatum]|uniref:30S ribosomal protein S6 n=1 Tax=Terrirubrum flagellatum TaxID=2895980 RepID=UPI003144F2AB
MALYEHVFLTRQDVTSQQVETLVETFKGVIEAGGGQLVKSEYWGSKSLAFRIKKNRKAHFQYFGIDAPHAAVAEMERQMGINEDVMRFMTIRVDAIEEGPSAMLRKRDDSERRDDDFGFGGGGRGFGGGGRSFGGGGRGFGGGGGRGFGGDRPPRPAGDGVAPGEGM